MTTPDISAAAFFEAKYNERSDPWNFAESDYELRRYDAIVSALNHRRYRSAFEPGCSIGVLTERLATLCDRVVAIDFSFIAVAQAVDRCSHCAGVEIHCVPLPDAMPVRGFDLVVLSEIGYYFHADEWRSLSSRLIDGMDAGTTLLAAHWLGDSADHCMRGDAVHEILDDNASLRLEYSARHEGFRLDRWSRL